MTDLLWPWHSAHTFPQRLVLLLQPVLKELGSLINKENLFHNENTMVKRPQAKIKSALNQADSVG